MCDRHEVKGYEAFIKFIKEFEIKAGKIANVLFSGEKDEEVSLNIFFKITADFSKYQFHFS